MDEADDGLMCLQIYGGTNFEGKIGSRCKCVILPPSEKFAVISYPPKFDYLFTNKTCLMSKATYYFATTHLEFVLYHNACPPIILARIFLKENVL
jgi:hypothetical protein